MFYLTNEFFVVNIIMVFNSIVIYSPGWFDFKGFYRNLYFSGLSIKKKDLRNTYRRIKLFITLVSKEKDTLPKGLRIRISISPVDY